MDIKTTPAVQLDLKGAAACLGILIPSLRALCKRRAVTFCRIDRLNRRFKPADLDDFLARNTVRAEPVHGRQRYLSAIIYLRSYMELSKRTMYMAARTGFEPVYQP